MSTSIPDSGSGSFRERTTPMAPSAVPSGGGEWSEPSTLPIAGVKELFVTLSKAIRAVQRSDYLT